MSAPIITLTNVVKRYNGTKIFGPLSLTIDAGDKILISGENGAGKTTLLRVVALLESIEEGKIVIDGHLISAQTPKSEIEFIMRENIVGFVFQELHPWPHMTVMENLTKPLMLIKQKSKKEAEKITVTFLKMVGLERKKDQYPSFLSGGQKRRLIIARTIVMDPKILLLDEITANLDRHLKAEIFNLIKELAMDKTMIIVSHEEEMLRGFVNKYYALAGGALMRIKK
jgi:ABC-type polar amino acid transport system ATPase subunit